MKFRCLYVSGLLISMCACGGQSNTVEISENALSSTKSTSTKPPSKTLSSKKLLSQKSEKNTTVQVFRSKGAIQCESKGDDLVTTAKILEDAGITVISSHCGYTTGMMMIAMCGSPTSDINVHTIRQQDLALSEKSGFLPVTALINEERGLGFELRDECIDDSEASK